jgi:hypothetical protein
MSRRHIERAARLETAVKVALMQMGAGAALHSEIVRGNRQWWLSSGVRIPGAVAEQVIQHHDVTGVGDSLFAGIAAQTYRYIDRPRRRKPRQKTRR